MGSDIGAKKPRIAQDFLPIIVTQPGVLVDQLIAVKFCFARPFFHARRQTAFGGPPRHIGGVISRFAVARGKQPRDKNELCVPREYVLLPLPRPLLYPLPAAPRHPIRGFIPPETGTLPKHAITINQFEPTKWELYS